MHNNLFETNIEEVVGRLLHLIIFIDGLTQVNPSIILAVSIILASQCPTLTKHDLAPVKHSIA